MSGQLIDIELYVEKCKVKDDYLDEFWDLISELGYTDAIVVTVSSMKGAEPYHCR